MIQNIHPDSGVAFGYIGASALAPEISDALYYEGVDLTRQDALDEYLTIERRAEEEEGRFSFDEDFHTRLFDNQWDCDEPIIEGERDGVHYRTSWLGGALHFFILESPHITHLARRASPCVPNAGVLDTLDGNVTAYDVPPEWRDQL